MRRLMIGLGVLGLLLGGLAGGGGARAGAVRTVRPVRSEPQPTPPLIEAGADRPTLLNIYGPVEVWLPKDLELEYHWKLPFDYTIKSGGVWLHQGLLLVLTERPDGPELWSVNPENGRPHWVVQLQYYPEQPPYISREGVYVMYKNTAIRIDRRTGQIEWRLTIPVPIIGNLAASRPMVYLASNLRRFHGLAVKWSAHTYKSESEYEKDLKIEIPYFHEIFHADFDDHIINDPVEDGGIVYFQTNDRQLHGFNDRGEHMFHFLMQKPSKRQPGTHEDLAVFGSTDLNCYCINRFNGVQRWRTPLMTDGARPAAFDPRSNLLYYPTQARGMFALRLADDATKKERGGEIAWGLEDAWDVAGISEFNVYLQLSMNRLACVDKRTGYVRWISLLDGVRELLTHHNSWTPRKKLDASPAPPPPPMLVPKEQQTQEMRIYLVSDDNALYCLKEKKEYWGPWMPQSPIPVPRGEKPIPAPDIVPLPPGFPGAVPPPNPELRGNP